MSKHERMVRVRGHNVLGQVARWGAVGFLALSGSILGLEGVNAAMNGTAEPHTVGLEFSPMYSTQETFVPFAVAPPREGAGFLLTVAAVGLLGAEATRRLTQVLEA